MSNGASYSNFINSASNSSTSNSPIGGTNGRYQATPNIEINPNFSTNQQFMFNTNNNAGTLSHMNRKKCFISQLMFVQSIAPNMNPLGNRSANSLVNLKVSFEKMAFYDHLSELCPPTKMTR